MKVKATKTMVTTLNKAIKDKPQFDGYRISLEKLTERQFKLYVDIDTYKHESDFNYKDYTFNIIKVVYPQNYFACDRYITTRDLIATYKASDKTYNGFINEFLAEIEI